MKNTVDVACYHCHTPNRIGIGVEFYEQRAFYRCCKCGKSSSLHIKQQSLEAELPYDIQEGRPIDG
jgi:uncharacterized CHY-type Zn-finger protein